MRDLRLVAPERTCSVSATDLDCPDASSKARGTTWREGGRERKRKRERKGLLFMSSSLARLGCGKKIIVTITLT